jgi:uncharacterized protein (DUF2249 family)
VVWFEDRWRDLSDMGSATWLAVAAWAAVVLGVAALIYAHQQLRRTRRLSAEQLRPRVVMFMEPHPTDWYVIELVVRNFGTTSAHNIRLAFFNPPTVAQYEHGYLDGQPDVAELALPRELPILAPGQEWRTVWDSAMDRAELGEQLESRFVGRLTYLDRPRQDGQRRWYSEFGVSRKQPRKFQSKVVLDWNELQPVQRLELITSHDLAKREKQKLELLRSLLTYFQYASKETRPDVLRAEIERINRAADETQERLRTRVVEHNVEPNTEHETTTKLELPWINNAAATGRHHHPGTT